MTDNIEVTVVPDVVPALLEFLASRGLERLTLVADTNTYRALGERVSMALRQGGVDLKEIVLAEPEVVPDERFIVQVLVAAGNEERTYLAVGSGVVTDIVRFSSHRTRTSFISLPTAPSVDGYTSISASLVLGNLKQTIFCQPPLAVLSDLTTLCAAPRPMIAAGFGDVLAKYIAAADWRLGHLIWDTPYDESVAQRATTARDRCVEQVEAIGSASPAGIRSLIEALAETGLCMLEVGASYPAAGAEHYVSHVWEMKLLQEGKPAILHGAKVGVATVLMAGYYQELREVAYQEARERLAAATLPDRSHEVYRIRAGYGDLAGTVIAEQAPFLDMDPAGFERLKQRILDNWAGIQAAAAGVPAPEIMAGWLRQVGGPVTAQELGFSAADQAFALEASHYLRNRFTVVKLSRMLGLVD